MTDQDQIERLRHKLITLMEKWLDQADQSIPIRYESQNDIDLTILAAYNSRYEAGMMQAVKDLSKLVQGTKRG